MAEAVRTGDMPRRILGRTKESVTILGLGCAWIGHEVDEAQTRASIEAALEGGVRYFDTSPDYKESEVRLGPVLSPVRDEIFLVTKTNCSDARGVEKELAQSLKLLKTDHVDLLMQHCVGATFQSPEDIKAILGKGGSLEFLRKAKKQGLTRFIGMSVHAPHAAALRLLDELDEWDVVMPFINYVAQAQQKAEAANQELFGRALRHNLGLVAMKVLGGTPGKMAEDYDRAFRYALSVPAVACALIGARRVEEVKRAVRAAKQFRPLSDDEMKETIRLGEEMARSGGVEAIILKRHARKDFGSSRA
jgi:predicted aldo/keto reductase-like oxidoreductase